MSRTYRSAARHLFASMAGIFPRARPVHVVLLAAFLLDTLLFGLVVSFLPGFLLARGSTSLVVGGVFAAYALGMLLATLPAGWLTDQIGARQVMLAGLAALVLSTLLFAFAPGLLWLFLARALQGASGAVTWTAGLALISQLSDEQKRPRLFAWMMTSAELGSLLGPPLGGFLYAWGGFQAPFLVAAGLVLLDGLGRLLLLPSRQEVRSARPTRGTLRLLLRHTGFLIALLVTLVGTALFAALDPVLPPLLSGQFGLQLWAIGVLFSVIVVSFAAMQPFVTMVMQRLRLESLMALALLVSALTCILLGLAESLVLVMGSFILLTCAAAFSLVPSLEQLTRSGQQVTAASGVAYGAIYAAYNLAFAGGTLLGPILAGCLTAWVGPHAALAWLGALPLVLATVIGMRLRSPRPDCMPYQ